MAALGVSAKLYFVDGNEIRPDLQRHRLDRADPILGAVGYNAFFAGDKRHHRGAARHDDAVINLARQQTQRQPDHPGAMGQHPFDGIMSLARIRRAKDRDDPR